MRELDHIDRETLLELAGKEYAACVSIYMPVIQKGRETRQNEILMRDLCDDAERKMILYGVKTRLIAPLLSPLRKIEKDKSFWETRPPGLAFFSSVDEAVLYHAPVAFDAEAIVDRRFYIRPLLSFLDRAESINVLLVNKEDVKLLRCKEFSCEETFPPDSLRSLAAFMKHHEVEKSIQFTRSSAAPHYHGHGESGDYARDTLYLGDYFRHLKNWLTEEAKLDGAQAPLYLAGDERSTGIFAEVAQDLPNRIVFLLQKNAREIDTAELLRALRFERDKLVNARSREKWDEFRELAAHEPDKALNMPAVIVAAAHDKRIRTLFLPPDDRKLWGIYDEQARITMLENAPDEPVVGEELYNLAAIRTLQSGGQVAIHHAASRDPPSAAICHW